MRQPRRSGPSVLAILLASLSGLSPAHAASSSFTGALNNDWSNGQNWTGGKPPSSADTAFIDRMPQLWLGAGPGTAGSLFIGLSRTASLYAATALSVRNLTLGHYAGSSGGLTLLGSAARLSASGTVIGQAGRGELNLYQAASIQARDLKLGALRSGNGVAVVAGQSTINLSAGLEVGGGGKGRLDLSGGARIVAGSAIFGALAGGSGSATVSGGDTLLRAGTTAIGKAGNGAVTVTTGATFSGGNLSIGSDKGGNGTLALSGGGTKLTMSGGLVVGKAGKGVATAYTGAAISAASMTVGEMTGSSGTFTGGNGGTNLQVGGTLSVGAGGAGAFRLQDGATGRAGRLVLGATATGSGNMTLSGGKTVMTASAPVEIGRAGQGAMLLTGEARLDARTIDLALLKGSSGTLSIGARRREIARGAGSLNASEIRFGAGSGTLVFNLGGPAYTLSSRLTGKGSIYVDAGSVMLTGGSGDFTGTTRVNGGTLTVNGSLGGMTAVTGYGTLAGTGSVGSVSVASGGTISPAGSSTGTFSVRGNLGFDKGGHFRVSVAPARGAADLLAVAGRTTIGSGAVMDVVQESAITLGRQDRVLISAGGIAGRFDTVTSNYAFVTPTVTNDGHSLLLTLSRNGTGFKSAAANEGARTVAEIGEGLAPTSQLYRQMVALSSEQARTAFSDMAGTIHAAPATLAFDVGRFARTAAVERAALAGRPSPAEDALAPSAMTAYMSPGYFDAARAFASVLEEEKRRGPVGWARAYGGYSSHAGDGGDRIGATGGMLFGWDSAVSDDLRLGILGGIGMGRVRESAKLSTLRSQDYTLGVYGGTEIGPVSLRFGTTYVHQDIDSTRTARFAGLSERLEAGYSADAVQTYGEIAHAFTAGDMEIEPFANLSLTWQRSEGFAETGGAAALTVTGAESTQAETLIGLRAAKHLDLLGHPARLRGMLGWNHAFEAEGDGPLFSFAGSSAFSLDGVDTAGDSLAVEAGLDIAAAGNGTTVGLTYGGNFSADAQSHLVKLTLSHQF